MIDSFEILKQLFPNGIPNWALVLLSIYLIVLSISKYQSDIIHRQKERALIKKEVVLIEKEEVLVIQEKIKTKLLQIALHEKLKISNPTEIHKQSKLSIKETQAD